MMVTMDEEQAVALVLAFVNTANVEAGTDDLESAADLAGFAAEHGRRAAGVGEHDVAIARRLREGLRAVLLAHHDDTAPDPAAAAAAAAEVPVTIGFDEHGDATVLPADDGPRAILADVLAAAAHLSAIGRWSRVKACPADDCRWGFYDRSRNRSRRWCSMEVCGNRAKVRQWRERRT